MQFLATLIPLLACALLVTLPLLKLTERVVVSFPGRSVLLMLTIALSLVNFSQFTIGGYLRGIVADLSLTTTVMLMAGCYAGLVGHAVVSKTERVVAGSLLVGGGLILYPMSLGFSSFDPYQWGYYPALLGALLSALLLIALYKEFLLIVTCLLAGLLAYSYGLLDSNNLWDYLIDPLAFIYGVSILLRHLARQISQRATLD